MSTSPINIYPSAPGYGYGDQYPSVGYQGINIGPQYGNNDMQPGYYPLDPYDPSNPTNQMPGPPQALAPPTSPPAGPGITTYPADITDYGGAGDGTGGGGAGTGGGTGGGGTTTTGGGSGGGGGTLYGGGGSVGGSNYASIYGNPSTSAIPSLDLNPNDAIHNMFYSDEGQIQAGGEQLQGEAINQLNYYSPLQQQYQQEANSGLNSLATQPGYTPQQEGQINVNYSQYNTPGSELGKQFLTPQEQQGILGNPQGAEQTMQAGTQQEANTIGSGVNAEGQMLNAYQSNIGNQLTSYQTGLGSDTSDYGTNVNTAATGLGTGLTNAQGQFSALNTAVNNPGLAFDPNNTEQQLTDADVNQMMTAAGTTIGNQYGTAEDTLNRNAAAAGNTSPLALAAANARLQTQEASQQGQAETNADIAARQAQYQRAAGIEQQREGAVQTQTGLQAGAATTEEGAAQSAAALAGTQDIAAQENIGQTGIGTTEQYNNAALGQIGQYGQTSVNTSENMTNQQYGAAQNQVNQQYQSQLTAEQLEQQREQALATNRQNEQTNVNQTQYAQGTGSAQMTSQGAQTVGNADIAGRNAYISGTTQQQGMAQQGGQAAMGQQQQAYGTQTSGVNQATANRANYETGSTSLGKSLESSFGNALGQTLGSFGMNATGGVFDKPTLKIIGERGPEKVVSLGPYRRKAA